MAGSMLVFIPSLGAYVTPDLLGGARSVMIGNVIYSQFMAARDYPFGAAVATGLMAVMVIGTIIYFRKGSGTETEIQTVESGI
jgi:spermidine/putrescine transport system permease protein